MARFIFSVTNDIVTDNRVHRITKSLKKNGHQIIIAGRKRKNSLPLDIDWATTHRFRLIFNKGPLFYSCYNIRLFFFLLFKRVDIIVANDLDSLPAAFLASRIRRKTLVYDSHEYFTEVPELVNRPGIKKIWENIEKKILPKVKFAYTVCDSIATEYKKKYNVQFEVIRNVAVFREQKKKQDKPEGKQKIIYQGVVNLGRGLELAIEAMKYLNEYELIIVGDGDIIEKLKEQVNNDRLEDRVRFEGRRTREEVYAFTCEAGLGLSLEEKMGLNYYYALPNKLFDYIQARIPVLVSDLPEMKKLVTAYEIGEVLKERDPEVLATCIKDMLNNRIKTESWNKNLDKAAHELCWENEEKKLMEFYNMIILQSQEHIS